MTIESSTVYLLEVESGYAVEAKLRDAISEDQLRDWEDHWQPALWIALLRLDAEGVRQVRPQSAHWNWQTKMERIRGLLAHQTFCIVCDGITQGMMQVDLTRTSRIESQRAKPLVYVDYLENAPWNRPELYNPARYRGVGSMLIRAAIELSLQEEFQGRIGLHSLPQANNFYGRKCGMTDLGPDAAYQGLRYFEMTPKQARSFIETGEEKGRST
ncbi:MAG: GNAT family N-acetyltransferase [Rhodospirillales bacterium]|nr:GNAT family N-acetyltransferase [Rhodospirillales bacterium]